VASNDEAERLHTALSQAFRRLGSVLEGARFEPRSTYTLVSCPSVPLPSFNGVWVDDHTTLAEIEAALDELGEVESMLGIVTRSKTAADVGQIAEELGYTASDNLPGMVTTPAEFRPPVAADGLEVLRLETADGFAQALAVASAGFEAPADLLAPLYLLEVTSLDGVTFYLGRADGKDVTTAMHFVLGGDVGIFNVATPVERRGHGYGAAVTAQAVSDGFDAGASFAYLQSSALGQSVYRRLGFREVETYTLFTRSHSH
jgi:ribosomal protein S18 acetylase RimI-like enzyme